jgi:hypothetical protein
MRGEASGQEPQPEPGARGPGGEGSLAPPAGLHGTEGPCRGVLVGEEGPAAAGGQGRQYSDTGESLRGSGPSISSTGPRPGVLCPPGAGHPCPQAFVSPVALGAAGPGLPHLSPGSALRLEGLWSGGRWGLGSELEGSHPCPARPSRPLGELLSRQLLLQVPLFWRPHDAGVGGTQRGPRSPVFLCLCGLLFHLHLVAVQKG